jgi:Fe-S-cluster formation regulator IscX/YfhJ
MEDDRVAILESQLSQAKLIAEEADKKYEEVQPPHLNFLQRHTLTHDRFDRATRMCGI